MDWGQRSFYCLFTHLKEVMAGHRLLSEAEDESRPATVR